MKYYIVIDPILNVSSYSFLAKSQKFDKETVLTAFRSQSTVKAFANEGQAIHFARSTLEHENVRFLKQSKNIAPIIECELELSNKYERKQEFCHALDGNPMETKTNLINMSVVYFEIPVSHIDESSLTRIFFDNENIASINIKNRGLSCSIS